MPSELAAGRIILNFEEDANCSEARSVEGLSTKSIEWMKDKDPAAVIYLRA